jgi:LPS sulfotransferase NodH
MVGRFIIFSLPRCGSTTLQRLLNCHASVRCVGEPFHPHLGRYRQTATDSISLKKVLRKIWASYNGIRHTWELSGWPFAKESHLNEEILADRGHKIIFLNRRNSLRRIVSHHISAESQIWSIFDQNDREKMLHFKFKPIETAWVEHQLNTENRVVANYRRLLLESRVDFLEVWYEDLYDVGACAQPGLHALNGILAFLGYDPISEPNVLTRVAELFDVRNTKLNSAETYRLIPQIEAVERRFGSNESGWLFRESGDRLNTRH